MLTQAGYTVTAVDLGEAEIAESLTAKQLKETDRRLRQIGFELIEDHKSNMVKKIKNLIIELIYDQEPVQINLSDYLTARLPYEYNYLSNLFSEQENNTIEKFYIQQKIERVKELLTYNELTLGQIAYQLGYSSVAHLSNQFKKITGFTPGYFKTIKTHKRQNIEEL